MCHRKKEDWKKVVRVGKTEGAQNLETTVIKLQLHQGWAAYRYHKINNLSYQSKITMGIYHDINMLGYCCSKSVFFNTGIFSSLRAFSSHCIWLTLINLAPLCISTKTFSPHMIAFKTHKEICRVKLQGKKSEFQILK